MATGVGDIFLDLKLNKQPFEKGMNETKATATMAGKKIGLAIAGAIAGAVATVGFGHLISATGKLGDAIDKTSQKMGMSAQTYQEWDFIMQRCGTSMESMTMAMKTLASSAVTSKDALAELGISQEEVASLSQEQLFARTIQALQNVEDTTKRTYLAGQLLGRGATELGAVLNMSASETDALRQRVYDLGGVMSQQAVTASAQYEDALLDLKMAFRGVSDTVAVTVLPIITKAINKVIIPLILRAVAVVRYFGSILSSAFGGLGKKIGGVFGKTPQKQNISFGKSIGDISTGIGKTGKSAKKTKKAIKELNRELMGFDKMNKLAKKTKTPSDSGAGGSGGAGGGGASGMGVEPMGIDSTNKKLGLFDRLSKKLAPIWKALGDVFRAVIRLFKALGKALAPVGKWLWKHIIKPFGKLLGMAIVAVLQGIAGAIELVALFVEKHPKLAVLLMALGTALFLIIKRSAVIGVLGKIGRAFKVLGGAIMAHPIALLLIGIALAIGYIYKNWDKIKKTKFGKFLITIGKACKKLGEAVKKWALDKFEKLKPVLSKIGKVLKKLGESYIKGVVTYFKAWGKAISTAWDGIKKLADIVGGALKKGLEKAEEIIGSFADAWDAIKDKSAKLTATLAGVKQATVEKLKTAWASISNKKATLTRALAGTSQATIDKLKTAWGAIKTKKATITKALAGVAQKTVDKLKTAWSAVKSKTSKLTTSLSGIALSTLEKFKKAWGAIKDKSAELKLAFVDKLKKGYNEIAKKIQETRKKHPATKIILPDIHPLAEGGWVGKNTPRLAVVGDNRHEGEIVSPESKLKAMATQVAQEVGSAGNAQIVSLLTQILHTVAGIDPNVYLDGKQIANNTVKQINQQTRMTGVSPLVV